MLPSQHFRGGHEHALLAVAKGEVQGRQGQHGLTGAHVPLDNAVHGLGLGHIGADIRQRPLLGAG